MKTIALILAVCGSLLAQTGRVVGKPYSATQVTHFTQTLANGSHIDRTTSNLVCQDNQGRFRTEPTDNERPIVIQDKVAMMIYTIDQEHKTVHPIEMGPAAVAAARKIAGDASPLEEARAVALNTSNNLVADLGSRIINGVLALGVRVTTTIPIGAIGNDQELKSVSERWYSNDIHALVRTVTTDPRTGVTTYELTQIVRAEPDPALFRIPAGFTVAAVEKSSPVRLLRP